MARHRRIALTQTQRNFGALGDLLAVALFTYTVMTLEWHRVAAGVGLALTVVVLRSLVKVACVTALAHASGSSWHKGRRPRSRSNLVYNYNRFQACRFGLDGTLVDPKVYASRSLREDMQATLQRLAPHADTLGSQVALELIRELTEVGNHASYLRAQYRERGSAEGMVEAAITGFRR
ncbi:hypothetical protein [Azohydromonas australica]|uniref:hypothetical protein n=1 Tax=Azohydromonas australica TaxID=364039 RepID=UPI0004081054|nr:hypothetical protein [Azohydromonas australica]